MINYIIVYLYIIGKYDDWMETPKGCIALVVLLDQFSRNMFRGMERE